MGKLFKFLKPRVGAVLAIVAVLIIQAYCDLSLPGYTSDIVNVGIQQGGIDSAIPEQIAKDDMEKLLLFVSKDDQKIVMDAYTLDSKTYKKEHENVKFVFNFDSSGTLKTQIEEGAPADIFISAAMKQMDELDKGGFIKKDSIVKLLENKVVLIQPKDAKTEISSFEDVATDKVSMVAIGNADVPVGQYTEQIYKNLGLWDQVAAKANLATNVSTGLGCHKQCRLRNCLCYRCDDRRECESNL